MTHDEFTEKVMGTQGDLRRFLAALCCGDTMLADDIAQETYLKAYLSLKSPKDIKSFKGWLLKIAHNTFLNIRRSSKPETDEFAATKKEIAMETADAGFKYQELYYALEQIPPKERTSILLYYMEGYDVNEIARITDASSDAVRQQLSRGRTHLRNLIAN